MAERYKQLKDMVHTKDLFQSVTVSDYLFTKCLLFAKVNLPEEEFRLYQKLFDIIHQQLSFPDILIYLHAPVQKLQANIKKRNRSYEQGPFLMNTFLTYRKRIRVISNNTISKPFYRCQQCGFFREMKNISKPFSMHWIKILKMGSIILACRKQ
jgi:deoxyguanosine kinase